MNAIQKDSLRRLAALERQQAALAKELYQPVTLSAFAPALRELACQICGQTRISDDKVIDVVFSGQVFALLETMPNPYWFWTIVESGASYVNSPYGLTGEHIQRAIWHERNRVGCPELILKQLTAVEACAWMSAGVILLKTSSGRKTALIPNPLFQP